MSKKKHLAKHLSRNAKDVNETLQAIYDYVQEENRAYRAMLSPEQLSEADRILALRRKDRKAPTEEPSQEAPSPSQKGSSNNTGSSVP